MDIHVDGVFDLKHSDHVISGVQVFSPDKIKDLLGEEDVLIGTVNWRNQEVIKKYLDDIGVTNELIDGSLMHSPLQRSICLLHNLNKEQIKYEECPYCFIERNVCDILRDNLIITKKNVVLNKGMSKLPLIGVIVGNICTLRCNHCVESVPHSKLQRHQEPKEKLIKEIRRVAEAIEFVTVVDFVGGEPFLHPDLPELIEETLSIPNIGFINIFTNGTVKPSPKLLEVLKKDYVVVNVSDYSGQLPQTMRDKITETVRILRSANIATTYVKDMTWYDISSFEKNNDNEEELKERFHRCRVNSCQRLYDNQMYRCLHLYSGYVTGKLQIDENDISIVNNIFDGDVESLARRLDNFWDIPYSTACKYCELPYISKLVPSGEQVKVEG